MRAARPLAALAAALFALGSCSTTEIAQAPPTVPSPPPPPPAEPVRADFEFRQDSVFRQGGVVRGLAPGNTVALELDGEPVGLADGGSFIIAFDRDQDPSAELTARLADGRTVSQVLAVAPSAWRIEHVNASPTGGVPSEEFLRRRRPELERIGSARALRTGAEGWRQDFLWPVTGRISGEFGSQRIYRGEPGSYHTGVDISRASGTPVVAPADGVVILAAQEPLTLEGHLLMIDHGMGLNSAFLHLSRIDVAEGVRVRRGQTVGAIGASGRATGPHLHWSMKWNAARIDPVLLAGPMTEGGS